MNFLRVIYFTNGMTNIKYCLTDNYVWTITKIGKEHQFYIQNKKKKTKTNRKISNSSKSNNRTD